MVEGREEVSLRIVANMPTTKVKKWDIEPTQFACTLPQNRKDHKIGVWEAFIIKGKFSIAKFNTIE